MPPKKSGSQTTKVESITHKGQVHEHPYAEVARLCARG